MLPLCSCLLQCYFTFFARHHTVLLPPRRLPLPPLCLFLPSVDICVSVSVPLSFTLFPLIPLPTHTHSLSLYCGQSTCAQKHLRQLFFFFILGSHLAALYSNYPRRGLTAGNINRVARSYIEHTLMHERRAHTCKATTLIAVAEAVQPCQPPFLKIHYCC